MQALFVKANRNIVRRGGMSFRAVTGVAGMQCGSMGEQGRRPWFGLLFLEKRRTTTRRKTRLTEIRMTLKRRIVLPPSWQTQITTSNLPSMNKG